MGCLRGYARRQEALLRYRQARDLGNHPGRPRNPTYIFISSRRADKVNNEGSIIIGYPFRSSADATVEGGATSFALYTQHDGAWIKNGTEEARLVEAMRGGQSAIVKGTSTKGTKTTDTF